MDELLPQTLLDAVRYFSDLGICHQYMRKIKWPDDKIVCPFCQSDRIGEVATRHLLRCKDCRKQIYLKTNTIFEDSPLGLDKWFPDRPIVASAGRSVATVTDIQTMTNRVHC